MGGSSLSRATVRAAYRAAARGLDLLGLKAAVRAHVLPRLLAAAQGSAAAESDLGQAAAAMVDREIRAALDRPGRILVGPWTSEVGFELVYWIPFLNWLAETYGVERDRLAVVTRGGAGVWYGNLAGETVDLFDLVSPDEFRARTAARWQSVGGQKQIHPDEWESELLARIRAERSGVGEGVLHPYLMYALFWGVWQGRAPAQAVRERVRFRPLPQPPAALAPDLPDDFAAVRFYFRPSFPDSPETRATIAALVERLAARRPVVLLNPGLSVDDHSDWLPAGGHGVHDLSAAMTPANNLAVQSSALARARVFVGTYGGLSYLAPLYGRPSIALRSHAEHNLAVHGELADEAARAAGGSLTVLDVSELETLDATLGAPMPAPRFESAAR